MAHKGGGRSEGRAPPPRRIARRARRPDEAPQMLQCSTARGGGPGGAPDERRRLQRLGGCAERQQGGRGCVRPLRRDRESAAGGEDSGCADAPRASRRPADGGGPIGALLRRPQAVARRSDSRPQALAPGLHPST